MKIRFLLLLILLGLFLPASLKAAGNYESPLKQDSPDQQIVGGLITISGLPGDEDTPRAAYSPQSDQYLVVFTDQVNNYDIKGRYVNASTGETVGGVYTIADNAHRERNPDVVYDPHYERFLVVWEKELCRIVQGVGEVCSDVIAGRMLYAAHSAGSQFAGSEFIVAHEHNVVDLHDPRIAYNHADKQYLVVYMRGPNAVHGQMLSAHTSYPSALYPTYGFYIRAYYDGSEVNDPDAAWGRDFDSFLVVWQNVKNFSEDSTIQAKYLHDTYQDGGSQIQGSEFKVAPFADGPDPLSNDCTFPVVAFNPVTGYYTVVFQHRAAAGIYQPSTLHAQLVKPYYHTDRRKGTAFPVETDLSEENTSYKDADIDYSGMGDTMYVVYIKIYSTMSVFDPRFVSVHLRRINGIDVSPALLIRAAEQDVDKY